ncbi:hypothetical protein FNH22_12380 [Fulvivirga sp. M361]|nr:hypothetical protein FNH22_12380 [Fulvivirga sp. M361]
MNDEVAARKIGTYFPEIGDKLLNIIQLNYNSNKGISLAQAGILQKSKAVGHVEFTQAVPLQHNRRYLSYFAAPFLILITLLVFSPALITSSTTRIIKFNEEFLPSAPFEFNLDNKELQAFKNEDFSISLELTGEALPKNAYVLVSDRKIKMTTAGNGIYTYLFKKIQSSKNLRFEAAGFQSASYTLNVVDRPALKTFNVYLNYPDYLNKKSERLSNVGNLQIPEGTRVRWELSALTADEVTLNFSSTDNDQTPSQLENDVFVLEKTITQSDQYTIDLSNAYGKNKQPIVYNLDVIPDKYPQITLNAFQDTTLFSFIALGGDINDDYGLTQLKLFYKFDEAASDYREIEIGINKSQNVQRYYYQWQFDSLDIQGDNQIRYYMQVWDNDGVNGHKSTKTGVYSFRIPSKRELKDQVNTEAKRTEDDIDKTLQEAKELKEEIEEAENRLKGKKELNWQDENLLKDILERREELNKAIEELKEQNQNINKKRERYNPQSEKIKEKVEKLQELMNDLLDEETKKLYDELQKLLEEQQNIEDIQDVLDQLNNKENNLEKELERTLELFKRMKFEHELDESINELNEQIKEQEELQEKTEEKDSDTEELSGEQQELQEKFEDFQEKLEQLEEINQDMKRPESLPDMQEEKESVKESQKESKELLEENKKKKAAKSQQNAKQQMQQMAEKMQQMQSNSQMSMSQENLDDLRDIVNNLLKLSFDQEDLMKEFGDVKQSDPRFIELSQEQLKLKDDAKIVEDSLLSLANRVFVLASFVTREVGDMNNHMDKSVDAIKERKKPLAVSEQQFAMTSMNNLALLLDDVLKQMQQNMADAMGQPQKGEGKQKAPSLGELQQQLNKQIKGLKESGKSGRQLSEELAKLAAEQERIRQALQEMQEKYGEGDNGQKPGDGLVEKMEETEIDLVNKQITTETIKRQRQILTRLLEAEDALRQRDKDEERKGETAKDYDKQVPKAFEEYFKLKEQEIELLKTIPPKLYPYYRKEVNDYFKRLGDN